MISKMADVSSKHITDNMNIKNQLTCDAATTIANFGMITRFSGNFFQLRKNIVTATRSSRQLYLKLMVQPIRGLTALLTASLRNSTELCRL